MGAGDAARTRDILLGKQTLCQLSYTRGFMLDVASLAGRHSRWLWVSVPLGMAPCKLQYATRRKHSSASRQAIIRLCLGNHFAMAQFLKLRPCQHSEEARQPKLPALRRQPPPT